VNTIAELLLDIVADVKKFRSQIANSLREPFKTTVNGKLNKLASEYGSLAKKGKSAFAEGNLSEYARLMDQQKGLLKGLSGGERSAVLKAGIPKSGLGSLAFIGTTLLAVLAVLKKTEVGQQYEKAFWGIVGVGTLKVLRTIKEAIKDPLRLKEKTSPFGMAAGAGEWLAGKTQSLWDRLFSGATEASTQIEELAKKGASAAMILGTLRDQSMSWAQQMIALQAAMGKPFGGTGPGYSGGYYYGNTIPDSKMGNSGGGALFTGKAKETDPNNPSGTEYGGSYSAPKYSGGAYGRGGTGGLGGIAKRNVSDAIISGGQVIQTSPNDMIIATNKQSGTGGSKVFNFYGVTPQEMINVIKAELGGSVWSVGRM